MTALRIAGYSCVHAARAALTPALFSLPALFLALASYHISRACRSKLHTVSASSLVPADQPVLWYREVSTTQQRSGVQDLAALGTRAVLQPPSGRQRSDIHYEVRATQLRALRCLSRALPSVQRDPVDWTSWRLDKSQPAPRAAPSAADHCCSYTLFILTFACVTALFTEACVASASCRGIGRHLRRVCT